MKIVTAAQMRELDRKAQEEYGIPGSALMEQAGLAVAEAACRLTEPCPEQPIAVICGRGNNGGDGFVAARHLRAMGRRPVVFLAASRDAVGGDARENLLRLAEVGLDVTEIGDPSAIAEACTEAGLVIDALLGTGLSGEVHGLAGDLIAAMNACGRPVLAVDIPSGLHSDTGKPLGRAVRAVETVTMGLPKLGLYLDPGMDYAGAITVADIGFPDELVQQAPAAAELIEPEWATSLLPRRAKSANKGDFGRVLIVAGSVGMTGAAAMAAASALRAGAGLVYVGCPNSLNDILEVKLTEAITVPLPETEARSLSPRGLDQILAFAERVDAVALGPGAGRHPETAQLLRQLVTKLTKPMVVDADGLNALSEDVSVLEGDHASLILTPHPGEMSRLLGISIAAVQERRDEVAQQAAQRFRAVALLKGACTLIAAEGRTMMVNPTGNPGMATGGTGDVLTGTILAFLGQGIPPFEAAAAGAYVHGLAGDVAAERIGQTGLIAGDLIEALPEAILRVAAHGGCG
jgi:hydroxyethylthiazole kinase-like uncharacterized protein yjeF